MVATELEEAVRAVKQAPHAVSAWEEVDLQTAGGADFEWPLD